MGKKDENEVLFDLINNDNEATLVFHAPLTISNAPNYDFRLDIEKSFSNIELINLDFSNINQYDSYFVLLVQNFRRFTLGNGSNLNLLGMKKPMADYLKAMEKSQTDDKIPAKKHNALVEYITYIGKEVKKIVSDTHNFIEFSGELFLKFLYIFYKPSAIRWKDFPFHFTRSGVGAVPIVILIVFLIGLISGYQGAIQLSRFGADIYIADLVGIAITRELGPLMTAILVAGRSGSAFAAELGTMKVSDEIDALETMGFDSMSFHIIPRILSVVVAMPLLTLITDLAGIFGGLVAALATLDISSTAYINQLQLAVSYADIGSGLIKSVVFGFLVAAIGCFRGMQVRGGAESVGKYTTASVVTGVFLIILADAVFTFVFQVIGV